MMKLAILGAGNWGTTLAIMLSEKAEVNLWTIEGIEDRENKKYLPGYQIPNQVTISSDLKRVLEGVKLLIFALPSQALRDVAKAGAFESKAILLSMTKGIENQSLKRMSEILAEETEVPEKQICVLSGPTIAREIVQGLPASCVCACKDIKSAETVQQLFSSPVFRVYTSTDVIGVELGGALKNVIVIAAGICDGIGLGANAKGALLSRGLREISRLGECLGADPKTFAGLSGIGDLITTSFSKHSRNRKVGEQIGKGRKLQETLNDMAEVAEGVPTTRAAFELSQKHKVSMPITHEIYRVLFEGKPPQQAITDLMIREPKPETL